MNPLEKMCDPYRKKLSCAENHILNRTTEKGNYFDGYAGFFRKTSDRELSANNPLKCFLNIGRDSWYQFAFLDYGKNKKWTESSFVLIDGQFAAFQPRLDFTSLPSMTFGWLTNQNISVDLSKRNTSTGIFIFNADSEVELYYNNAQLTGWVRFGNELK